MFVVSNSRLYGAPPRAFFPTSPFAAGFPFAIPERMQSLRDLACNRATDPGSCSSARSCAPRFLPTLGRPHAVALPFARCDLLAARLPPVGVRPCWAHPIRSPGIAGANRLRRGVDHRSLFSSLPHLRPACLLSRCNPLPSFGADALPLRRSYNASRFLWAARTTPDRRRAIDARCRRQDCPRLL
jgi:hypothetical protein